MANDRLYVECPCGANMCVAKDFVGIHFALDDTPDAFMGFLNEHKFCGGSDVNQHNVFGHYTFKGEIAEYEKGKNL